MYKYNKYYRNALYTIYIIVLINYNDILRVIVNVSASIAVPVSYDFMHNSKFTNAH